MTEPKTTYTYTEEEIEKLRQIGERLHAQGVKGIKRRSVSLTAVIQYLIQAAWEYNIMPLEPKIEFMGEIVEKEGKLVVQDARGNLLVVKSSYPVDGRALVHFNPDGELELEILPPTQMGMAAPIEPDKKSARQVGRFVLTYPPSGGVRVTSFSGVDNQVFPTEAEAEAWANKNQ